MIVATVVDRLPETEPYTGIVCATKFFPCRKGCIIKEIPGSILPDIPAAEWEMKA